MSLLDADPAPTDPRRIELELSRVCDRLRSMALTRLSARRDGVTSPAAAAFALAQELADATARVESRSCGSLPELADPAAADVLAVCGHDLVAALRCLPPGPARDDLNRWAAERLAGLRRSI